MPFDLNSDIKVVISKNHKKGDKANCYINKVKKQNRRNIETKNSKHLASQYGYSNFNSLE
jgi:hypothetical protein